MSMSFCVWSLKIGTVRWLGGCYDTAIKENVEINTLITHFMFHFVVKRLMLLFFGAEGW